MEMGVVAMKPIERKITKIGNSYGVTIPIESLKEVNMELGDLVTIDVKDGELVMKKSQTLSLPKGVNPKFAEAMSRTLDRYEETLRALKDR